MTDYIAKLAELEKTAESPAPSVPLRTYGLGEFLGLEFPKRQMLLSPWLPEKGLAMVYAPRGIGKTFFGLTTAYAVATGATFLEFHAPSPRKIIYIDGEMAAGDLQKRLKAIAAGFSHVSLAPDNFRILSADQQEFGLPDLALNEGLGIIDAQIGDADLIVLDNLSTLVRSGKENEAEAWSVMQAWALQQRRSGKSVLFVHHAGKSGAQRGTSKREDVLDSVVALSHPNGYHSRDGARFNVHFEKARHFHGKDAEAFEARYEERDGMALWSRSRIITNTTPIEIPEGLSVRKAAKAAGVSKSTLHRRKQQQLASGISVPLSHSLDDRTLGQYLEDIAAELNPAPL